MAASLFSRHLIVSIYFIGVVLSLVQNSVSQGRNIDPETRRKIDDFIQNVYLPASKISNLGLAVVQNDGEILYTTGFGYADQEKMIPNGNNTQFLIGSVTKVTFKKILLRYLLFTQGMVILFILKSFTAAVIIKTLSEKFPDLGEKVLDTPIRKLIPSANFTLNDRYLLKTVNFSSYTITPNY